MKHKDMVMSLIDNIALLVHLEILKSVREIIKK